jgi:hypothetical protein
MVLISSPDDDISLGNNSSDNEDNITDGAPSDDEEITSPDEDDDQASSIAADKKTGRPNAYCKWTNHDSIMLVKMDGKLLKENVGTTVPESMLLQELQKADPPLIRTNVNAETVGDHRKNLKRKFLRMLRNGGKHKRKFRRTRRSMDARLYKCFREAWPHIEQQFHAGMLKLNWGDDVALN